MKKLSKSFFDNNAKAIDSFWEKEELNVNQKMVQYECLLFQKSSKTGFWISRNYCVLNNKLVKFNTNTNKVCFVNLNLARVELIKYKNSSEKEKDHKKKYGFRVVRNMQQKELYSRTKEQNLALWEVLKKNSILTTFKDDFNLLKVIGKGNFAKVYLANKKTTKKQFAVKCFDKSNLTNGMTDQKALLKEIEIIRKICHKGLIQVHEVYEDEAMIYIVQDYLEGGELYHHIKKNQPLSEAQVARIIATLLQSIDYLHSQNILHRDLKPENMILRTKGVMEDVVIADFGLADIYDPLGHYMFSRCGTPGFVAPEVLQDKIYDSKVDIYSIGCLMFLLLSGKSPFKGSTYDEVVMHNYYGKVNFAVIEGKVSSKCLNLLKLLLHTKPSNRPNCKEALRNQYFETHLDANRFKELNEPIVPADENQSGMGVTSSPQGLMKLFVKPINQKEEKQDFSTPQIERMMKIQEQQLLTPQLNKAMQQIQEQLDEQDKEIEEEGRIQLMQFDDFTDLQMEDDSPQSHRMPEYCLVGKMKQGMDSRTSSYYASPLVQCTPQNQLRKMVDPSENNIVDTPTYAGKQQANKVMMNLKKLEI